MHFKQVIRKEEIHYQRSKDNHCLLLRRSRLVVQEVFNNAEVKILGQEVHCEANFNNFCEIFWW